MRLKSTPENVDFNFHYCLTACRVTERAAPHPINPRPLASPEVNYHYGELEDQGILTLKHLKDTLGVFPQTTTGITTEPSHRFTGAYQSLFLRLFWLGIDPPEHVKTAYKRL